MTSFLSVVLLSWTILVGAPIAAAAERSPNLESIKAERNLEKRARQALRYAQGTVDRVLEAYQEGDPERGIELLAQIRDAVELSQRSLKATGKDPFRNPKHFKRAEIETRGLLRDLDALRKELVFDEREHLDTVRARIAEINEELLMAIMTKKKKK